MKTIQEALHRGLLVGHGGNLGIGLLRRVGRARSRADQVLRNGFQALAKGRALRREVLDDHAVVKLSPALQQRSDKSYAETAAKIAEQVGNAGGLIVLVQWKVGIGQGAYRNEKEAQPHTLQGAGQSVSAIVGSGIKRAIAPHGK